MTADTWDIAELDQLVSDQPVSTRFGPRTRVTRGAYGTVITSHPDTARPPRDYGGIREPQPPNAHQVVQLRKLKIITRAEARRFLGLPVRWWLLGR